MMTIATTKIQTEILEKGYLHIKFPASRNAEEILSSIGSVLLKTEIRENTKSTRLLSSNQKMSFHTDHFSATHIAWFCNSQSSTGGESLLIDTKNILSTFNDAWLELLREISIKTHQIFYGDKLSLPLISDCVNESGKAIYYAQWMVNNPSTAKHQNALEKFEKQIELAKPIKLLLSEGDLLIIDNHRMLHGREGFPSNSNRWLTRYWLQSKHNK